jgi:hypothetical protein
MIVSSLILAVVDKVVMVYPAVEYSLEVSTVQPQTLLVADEVVRGNVETVCPANRDPILVI